MNIKIQCPLTNLFNIKLERVIKTDFIINEWKKSDIDVSRFFQGINEIYIYRCLDTDYRFYYPFNLEGDDKFYKDLQKYSWYYMDWKWEYQKVFDLIKQGDKVLEIGCGDGSFIKRLKDSGIDVFGLELSVEAVKKCEAKGLRVFKEIIQEYAKNNKEKYDIVCSFQVMEHIADIGNAIEASIDVLKNGGKLIISVPNNESFIRKDKNNLLNMPPHHMGLWNEKSLKSLEKIFKLQLENLYFEPLQSYHYRYYYEIVIGNIIKKILGRVLADRLVNKFLEKFFLFFISKSNYAQKIKGHTIMAIYKK